MERTVWRRALAALALVVAMVVGGAAGPVVAQAAPAVKAAPGKATKGQPSPAKGGFRALVASYFYAGGSQIIGSAPYPTGAYANSNVKAPFLVTGGTQHTLLELSVQKDGSRDGIVEIGWNVDDSLYGNTNPHFFTFAWKSGSGLGYQSGGYVACTVITCGAVPVYAAGGTATAGTSYQFRIEHRTTPTAGWWIWISPTAGCTAGLSCWAGYWPDTLWTASPSVTFTSATVVQAFGENTINGGTVGPCSDMGSGDLGSSAPSPESRAYWGSFSLVGGPTPFLTAFPPSNPAAWNNSTLTGTQRTIFIGGPGTNMFGNTPGTKGSC